jgi:hypothetical protein
MTEWSSIGARARWRAGSTALDFLPSSVCSRRASGPPPGFIATNTEILRSLAVVLRAELAASGRANDEPVRDLLGSIHGLCEEISGVFRCLAQFRSLPLEQVQSATETLARSYRQIRQVAGIGFGTALATQPTLVEEIQKRLEHIGVILVRLEAIRDSVSDLLLTIL